MQIEELLNHAVFTRTTNDIKVSVIPTYLEEHSDPAEDHYVWAYTVQVENGSNQKVQLINRHWVITDGQGQIEEVRGEGVVGEQPILEPGEGFRYTSGTSLRTPTGMMSGEYEMECAGKRIWIDIPVFSLDSPHQLARPN